MNILVYDIAASSSGALTVLEDFYKIASNASKDINWYFIVSTPKLEDTDNIKIISYPWIKKGWMHRIYFELFLSHKLVKKYQIDRVVSLQNIMMMRPGVEQMVLVHNCIPFIDYRFKFSENKLLWIYQNVLGRLMKKSIRKCDATIVQTEWMKKHMLSFTDKNKVFVCENQIDESQILQYQDTKEARRRFFYPAGPLSYKDHQVILDACKQLKQRGFDDFEVCFTMSGEENALAASIQKQIQENDLPVSMTGVLERSQVYERYADSVLLFPSYIETVGLPLMEARTAQSMICAVDCEYSKEILEDNPNVSWFPVHDANGLADAMLCIMNGEKKYSRQENQRASKDNIVELVMKGPHNHE